MKIDFNKDKSMNIKLDKVPRLLYINEKGVGCGQVYLDGRRIKALYETNIHAKTNEDKIHFIEYVIKYFDTKNNSYKTISNGFKPIFQVAISLKDTDVFKELLSTLTKIFKDRRIPEEIKNYIKLQIESLTQKNEEE